MAAFSSEPGLPSSILMGWFRWTSGSLDLCSRSSAGSGSIGTLREPSSITLGWATGSGSLAVGSDPGTSVERVVSVDGCGKGKASGASDELSPNFGDGLKDQAVAWA